MYFNPISYFLKSFIRLFTRRFFWIILILIFLCIGWVLFNTEVSAATSEYSLIDIYSSSNISTAQSYAGSTIWNDDSYDIFIYNCADYGARDNLSWQKAVLYWKVDDSTNPNCKYMINTNNIYLNGLNPPNFRASMCLVNFNGSSVSISNVWRKSIERATPYVNGPDNYSSSSNPGWYGSNSCLADDFICFNFNDTKQIYMKVIRSHYDICDADGNIILPATNPVESGPYFVTSEQDIQNWNFDYLEISGGDVPYYTTSGGTTPIFGNTYTELTLTYNYVNYDIDISQFIVPDYDNNTWSIKIPKNYLFNYVNVQNGIDFKFTLYAEQQYPFEQYSIETNNMTFNLTAEQLAQINNDTDKQMQGTIVQQQQQIQNSLTDTTVPADSEFDLPTIEVNDTTSNFFDTLFTGIYNAFNTNEDVSISFTIFSKTITINSADFRMLNDSRFTILRNLLESSWYFAIGYMILKDIRHIFDKIKTGNIENAVSNDIKADMV